MISQLIILAILIFLNAFFAAAEIAFISLNDAKIEKQAKEGNKKAKQIEKMLKAPSKFLATIQIGITLARIFIKCICIRCICRKISSNAIPGNAIYKFRSMEKYIYNSNYNNIIILYTNIWGISTKKISNEKP